MGFWELFGTVFAANLAALLAAWLAAAFTGFVIESRWGMRREMPRGGKATE